MSARLSLGLGALALVGLAYGDTKVVTASIPSTQTNWTDSLVVPQFNISGAHLDSIDIAFQGSILSTIRLENRDLGSITYSAGANYDIAMSSPFVTGATAIPSAAILLDVQPGFTPKTGTLAAYDGTLDFAGTSGITFSNITGTSSGSTTLTSASDLATFMGSGTVTFPVAASASSAITGSGNMTKIVLTQAAASVTVTYHYTPYVPLGSIGDRLFFDANNNGVQDPGEKGLVGYTVKLLDANGTVLKTTVTGKDGLYLFDNLPTGDYRVQFDKPAGYNFVARDAGNDDSLDSDVDGSGLTPDLVHLNPGQNRLDVDAGVAGNLCVGDRVWKDYNGNGLQDCNEPGVPGVAVHLLDANGNDIADTVTDSGGYYKFSNVGAGNYTVDFDAPAGNGFTKQYADSRYKQFDSNADPATGLAPVTLTNTDLTIDAGLVGALKIGDTVWLDSDGDGKFDVDQGEKGIKGVDVYLWGDIDGDGKADVYLHTVTDANGHYSFNSLFPGTYLVSVDPNDLRGLTETYDLDGRGSANYAVAKLLPGVDNLDFDFGYKPASGCRGANHCWWQSHPECWTDSCLWVGGKCHPNSVVCGWFKVGDCADKTVCLYQRLCASKLNVGYGCDHSAVYTCGRTTCSVKDAIKACDAWMVKHPVGCNVSASSADWAAISDCFGILDKYCGK